MLSEPHHWVAKGSTLITAITLLEFWISDTGANKTDCGCHVTLRASGGGREVQGTVFIRLEARVMLLEE